MRAAETLALALLLAGCSPDSGALGSGSVGLGSTGSPTTSGSSGTAEPVTTTSGPEGDSTFGMPPDDGTTSTTTGNATSSDGSTDTGGSTGDPPVGLANTGLLARWYIDESNMGKGPTELADETAPPLNLMMLYEGGTPVFDEIDGHRGLRWVADGTGGRALAPIAGTKIENMLGNSPTATVEVVLAVAEVVNQTSRFFHIGTGNDGGDFVVGTSTLTQLELRWNGSTMRTFAADFTGDRQVVHVVVDTTQADPADRLRAYLNGTELLPQSSNAPGQNDTLPLQSGSSLTLGNRTQGSRSFRGRLHYAAVYDAAFTPTEVMQNADALGLSDDSP